jgi:hypothetical protein
MKVLAKKAYNQLYVTGFGFLVLIGVMFYALYFGEEQEIPTYFYVILGGVSIFLFYPMIKLLISPRDTITIDGTYLYLHYLKREEKIKLTDITRVDSKRARHRSITYKYGTIIIETSQGSYRSDLVGFCDDVKRILIEEIDIAKNK